MAGSNSKTFNEEKLSHPLKKEIFPLKEFISFLILRKHPYDFYYLSAKKAGIMNIFSFTAHFGSEEDCRLHFKEQRDKEGVVCKR